MTFIYATLALGTVAAVAGKSSETEVLDLAYIVLHQYEAIHSLLIFNTRHTDCIAVLEAKVVMEGIDLHL